MTEQELQSAIRAYLLANNVFCFKIHIGPLPGGKKNPAKGCPDLIAIVDGRFLGIEVKNPIRKEKASPSQIVFHEKIKNSNGAVVVARDLKTVINEVERLKKA